jgi:hypothetical protein
MKYAVAMASCNMLCIKFHEDWYRRCVNAFLVLTLYTYHPPILLALNTQNLLGKYYEALLLITQNSPNCKRDKYSMINVKLVFIYSFIV